MGAVGAEGEIAGVTWNDLHLTRQSYQNSPEQLRLGFAVDFALLH
jgi:hypothetical protein